MEYKQLGGSGLRVPVLSFGTATFGGAGEFFKAWGQTQLDDAKKLVQLCMDAGVNFFDTADVYSGGVAEEILGKALLGIRNEVLLSTKATFKMGDDPNYGSSRFHLIRSVETASAACKQIILTFTTCMGLMAIRLLKKPCTR